MLSTGNRHKHVQKYVHINKILLIILLYIIPNELLFFFVICVEQKIAINNYKQIN